MIQFTEDGETYSFDPETGESDYHGESSELISVLGNIESMAYKLVPPEEDVEGASGAPTDKEYDPEEAEQIVRNTVETLDNLSLVESSGSSGSDEKIAPQVVEGPLEGPGPSVYSDFVIEKRVYIDDPSEVPEGATVHEGERGGLWYDDGEAMSFQEFQRDNNVERLSDHNYPQEQVDNAVGNAQRVFEKSGDIFETWLSAAQQTGEVTGASHRVKGVGSALEKAIDRKPENYDGDVSNLDDWHGTEIKFETVDDVERVFEEFQEDFDIIEAENKLDPDNQYRACHLIAEVEGERVELQLKQNEHSKIATASHSLTFKPETAPVGEMETLDEPVVEGSELYDKINDCLQQNADFIQGLADSDPECEEQAQAVIQEFFEVSGL